MESVVESRKRLAPGLEGRPTVLVIRATSGTNHAVRRAKLQAKGFAALWKHAVACLKVKAGQNPDEATKDRSSGKRYNRYLNRCRWDVGGPDL
jgi:hypothetical protein